MPHTQRGAPAISCKSPFLLGTRGTWAPLDKHPDFWPRFFLTNRDRSFIASRSCSYLSKMTNTPVGEDFMCCTMLCVQLYLTILYVALTCGAFYWRPPVSQLEKHPDLFLRFLNKHKVIVNLCSTALYCLHLPLLTKDIFVDLPIRQIFKQCSCCQGAWVIFNRGL